MENSTVKSLKLPLFDGTTAKFQIWWVRFKAFTSCSGFSKALEDSIEPAMPATELTAIAVDDAGALVKRAKERNQLAFTQLTVAFTTEAAMTFIYKGMIDTDWPSGLAKWIGVPGGEGIEEEIYARRHHLQGGAAQDDE
jgi:hypothetical protein